MLVAFVIAGVAFYVNLRTSEADAALRQLGSRAAV